MPTGETTEHTDVAKKKTAGRGEEEQGFDRIELQAPAGWVKELDAAAAAVGLSRSAYIRLACNRLMSADRRERGEVGND